MKAKRKYTEDQRKRSPHLISKSSIKSKNIIFLGKSNDKNIPMSAQNIYLEVESKNPHQERAYRKIYDSKVESSGIECEYYFHILKFILLF